MFYFLCRKQADKKLVALMQRSSIGSIPTACEGRATPQVTGEKEVTSTSTRKKGHEDILEDVLN